jgi:hypothetical protein
MTIFYTEGFRLDLTHLNITFSEENPFFEKDLIKQQSFPFKIKRERNFISFFEFVDSHNSVDSNKYTQGILFRNDKYYEAELVILNILTDIDAMFYYSPDKLTIFDIPLKALPWPEIEVGDDIYQFAKDTIAKDYPDTVINFHEVCDEEKYKDNDWGPYSGFINKNENGDFQKTLNTVYGLNFPVMNEMRPFIYVKEIMSFIFDQVGYTITGDFDTNSSISKALQYHNNSIFYTNKEYLLKEELDLTLSQSNISGYTPATVTYNRYVKGIIMYSKGSYKVDFNIRGNFTVQNEECHVQFYFKNTLLGSLISRNNNSATFDKNISLDVHVPIEDEGEQLEIRVICSSTTKNTIESDYEITGTERPLYNSSFSLSELLPDVTVGEYVTAVKESFVLNSVFDEPTKTVKFDFFYSISNNPDPVDLSDYMINKVSRKLNKSIGYKISFADGEALFLNKKGDFIPEGTGYTEYNIPLQPLKVIYIDALPAVKHQEQNSITFFESNALAKPLVAEDDISYSRLGFVHAFLRNWLYQLLNSEEYNQTLKLPVHISSKLTSESFIWFYNNTFLVHKIKRYNTNLLFEKLTLKLFKLKSYPLFNPIVDLGDGNTQYDPPTAFTSNISFGSTLVTQFNATIYPSAFGGPSSFIVDIYANGSSDPQGLDLSFAWEVLSSPGGNALGIFQSQNSNHSITRFTNSGYINLAGDYNIRLTVVNSVGLSDTIDIIVTAS